MNKNQSWPQAYLEGSSAFRDFELVVTPDVLIPRPETELLVEKVLASLDPRQALVAVDVGIGSGAIAISLAAALPRAQVIGIDIAPQALAVAQKNISRYQLERQISLVQGDLLSVVSGADVIVANLPYVAASDMNSLPPEVLAEPWIALNGGEEGLEVYRRFLPQAFQVLHRDAPLFAEIGYNQGTAMVDLMEKTGFVSVKLFQDYAGLDRIVTGVTGVRGGAG